MDNAQKKAAPDERLNEQYAGSIISNNSHNGYSLAWGSSATSKAYKNVSFSNHFSLFGFIQSQVTYSDLTSEEFDALKAHQESAVISKDPEMSSKLIEALGRAKNGPGMVGRLHSDGPKTGANVAGRSFLALDIDHGDANTLHDLLTALNQRGLLYLIYSTFSHRPRRKYRYRVVVPFDRELTDKLHYDAVARTFAKSIDNPRGDTWYDGSTFGWARMNFLPLFCSDIEPEFYINDLGSPLNTGEILASADPNNLPRFGSDDCPAAVMDNGSWTHPEHSDFTPAKILYKLFPDIEDFIQQHLSATYMSVGRGAYAYVGGTSGLLKIYSDGACAFYHGGSDPAGLDEYGRRHRVTAYDLALTHKFAGDRNALHDWISRLPGYGEVSVELSFGDIPLLEGADTTITPTPDPNIFQFKSMTDIIDAPAPEWQVEGIIAEKSLSIIYGDPASYKSFLAQHMALSIAYGVPWMSRQVKQGGVLYIAAEGQGGIGKRLKAWKAFHNIAVDSPNFYMYGSPINMGDAESVKKLIPSVPLNVRMVIVDTLNRSMVGADENSAKDVGNFMHGCAMVQQALGVSVVIIHHAGKSKDRGMRGSTAIEGAADTVVKVLRDAKMDGYVNVSCGKQKDFEEFASFSLRVRPVEESLAVEYVSPFECFNDGGEIPWEPELTSTEQAILDLLGDSYDGMAPREIYTALGVHENTWKKYRKSLLNLGLIEERDGRYISRHGPDESTS